MNGQFTEESDGIETPFTIFKRTRILLFLLSAAILILCVISLFFSVFGGASLILSGGISFVVPTPNDFGLSVVLPMSLISTVLLALPWENENIAISQIGPIALERKIEGQAREQEIELAEIQSEIQSIRDKLSNRTIEQHKNSSGTEFSHSGDEEEMRYIPKELEEMLFKFWGEFDRWAFSPSRISQFGPKQNGFEKLSKYNINQIRAALRQLVLQGKLVTRVSKKGNTLYRVPK